MFTGIIQQTGRVVDRIDAPHGMTLRIDPGAWDHQPSEGDSIAVNGCCLTVHRAGSADKLLRFDVVPQTLQCTTAGDLQPGDRVHLEHAATPTTLLGGHLVQGHIDGVAEVTNISQDGGEHRLRLRIPNQLSQYIIPKGSIALNGVSLTIASVHNDTFYVALIPATLELTTLGDLNPGDHLNLETDYIAKIIIQRATQIAQATRA